MDVLITGGTGQLGQALISSVPSHINLIIPNRFELDLSKEDNCFDFIERYKPQWVINAGAFTKVDLAESQFDIAMAVNSKAPLAFSKALKKTGGKLLHISTDAVFDGKTAYPLKFDMEPSPLNSYGISKAEGEVNIKKIFGGLKKAIILRTSWLVGPVGNNFALTMLKKHREKEIIKVVQDQVGSLTSTLTLANACWEVLRKNIYIFDDIPGEVPILHWCDAGVASWYDIAVAVGEMSTNIGLIKQPSIVEPITSYEFPSIAKRPRYSILDCKKTRDILSLPILNWRSSLFKVLVKSANL